MAFREGFVEADGFRIRYMEAGQGTPLVHLHGAGGMRLTRAHDLLSQQLPGDRVRDAGLRPVAENTRTATMRELARRWRRRSTALGIDRFNLMATSFGGRVALWLALQQPERVQALVLEAPAAIRPAGHRPPSGTPEEIARPTLRPSRAASARCRLSIRRSRRRQRALVGRLRGRTAMRISRRGCATSRRRPWCCSAPSIG